jgi:hypothetical protein
MIDRAMLAVLWIGCSSTPSTGGDASSGGGGEYAAYATIGGLDHLRITKTVGSTCFAIDVANPDANGAGLTLPPNWGFAGAAAMQPAAACDPTYPGLIRNQFAASSQSGVLTWQGANIPTTVDRVQATMKFAHPPDWCPASEPLDASSVPVH